jgi:hypothetical protein
MQLSMLRISRSTASKSDSMMIGIAAQKGKSSRLDILGINIRHFEPQDLRVETNGTIEVTHLQHHVPKTLYLERHARRWSQRSQLMDIYCHDRLAKLR